ncbi:hypothetical protein [Streptomyces sp. NPDC058486]|uniref:hypothetical protein n=1 Tax=unclassified Streptomyces TaxID=2593676 RepID=UPI003665F197
MTTHFTDRDERLWQRYAEERPARPLPVATWLRTLRATLRSHRPADRTTRTPVPERSGTGVRLGRGPQATR